MKSQIKNLSGIAFGILLFTIIISSSSCNKIERDTEIVITDQKGAKDTLRGNVACTNNVTYIKLK